MRTVAVPSDDLEPFDRIYVSNDFTKGLRSMLFISSAQRNDVGIL